MKKLLIVDDDVHLRKLVLTYGEAEGFACEEAENGLVALDKVENTQYDLILLDVMMPGMDGFETLGKIRAHSQVPVIMLTARDEEYDKLQGFHLGADDYVPKPFSPKELMARAHAVLKRSGVKTSEVILQYGVLCIRLQARSVTLAEKTLNLTPKEFDLLATLAQNERVVMTREQLLDKVMIVPDLDSEEMPVRMDALKMCLVMRNLLNNAINHTKDGGTITVAIHKTSTGVRVAVTNPGDPIPEADRALIWERYQRSQHQGGRRQGTGIGLSIVSSVLTAHEMKYGVDCEGGFTTFWFECSD